MCSVQQGMVCSVCMVYASSSVVHRLSCVIYHVNVHTYIKYKRTQASSPFIANTTLHRTHPNSFPFPLYPPSLLLSLHTYNPSMISSVPCPFSSFPSLRKHTFSKLVSFSVFTPHAFGCSNPPSPATAFLASFPPAFAEAWADCEIVDIDAWM